MISLPSNSSGETLGFDRIRPLLPESMAELDRAVAVAAIGVDPRLLELATGHAEAMLRGDNPTRDETMGDLEHAVADFAEQFVFSVSNVSDEHVNALLAHMTADEVHDFITALFVHEMAYRIELVTRKVLR